MVKSIFIKSFLILLLVLSTVSCDKEKEDAVRNSDLAVITDEAIASYIFNDVFGQVSMGGWLADQAIMTPSKSTYAVEEESCPNITITPFNLTEWPKTMEIDFGQGCNEGGVTRAGKIIVNVSKRFWEEGSVWTVEFTDFFVQGHKVEGTKTVSFNGRNDSGNFNWDIDISDAVITTPAQVSISWDAERNREWVEGEQTIFNPADDRYLITGGSSGVNEAGESYVITITDPLDILLSCPWVRSGALIIDITGRPDIEVDFGDGECDNMITVTINGSSQEVALE